MQCPKCYKICESDDRFCKHCGAALTIPPTVCANCGVTLAGDSRFCINCGQPVIAQTPDDDARLVRLTATIPDTLAQKMRAAHIAGERKVVTCLFADVVGSTAIAEKMDAEVWTEIMNHAFERLSPAIYRYEGTITRLMGDSLLAFFGAPVTHEDDPVRAVHAALDLITTANEYAEEVKQEHDINFMIRVGINSGTVVVGEVGSDLKYEYTAMGDAVNLAARYQQIAEPGQIVVSRSIYNATRTFFDFKSLKKVKVKGKAEKVERFVVIGLKEVFQELKGLGYGQLVGREGEMEALQGLVSQLQSGKGGVLEIKGEAGIGKSRLKYELRQLIKEKDMSFYQGYSPAYEIQIPYYPFSLILKEVLKLSLEGSEEKQKKALTDAVKNLEEDLIDTVPYLGAVLSLVYPEVVALDDKSRQERIFSAMVRIFERLSHNKPLVLVFEDLQWIDSLSKSLLTYLIEHSQDLPILFCCLYRPEFEPSWKRTGRVLLELRAIEKEEEMRLIGSLLGELSLPQNLVDLILSKSEGNPFYLEEMLRSLMDSGILVKGRRGFELRGEIGDIDIPDTIQGVIMSRLDRLERRAKETLQYASVIGREFPQRLLEEISERGREVEEQLSLLQRLELVFQKQLMPELEYIFKHFLTQSVAYNSILLKKRRELHLKIAKSIEKLYKDRLEEYYELLGHHYERAESWLKATEYFGKAGKKSSELHSKEVTTEHRKREEAAYGRLIFQFVLVAILVVVGLTISAFLERSFPLTNLSTIVPLRLAEASERLLLFSRVPRSFIIGIVTLILISGFFIVFRLIAKAFCPPWVSTKIDWRYLFRFRFASEESIWKEIISTIIMFAITLLSLAIMLAITLLSSTIVFVSKPMLISIPGQTFSISPVPGSISKFFLNLIAMVSGSLFWLVFSRGGILRTPTKIQIPPLGQAIWIGLHGAIAGGLIYNTSKLGFRAVKEFSQFSLRSNELLFFLEYEFIAGVIFITCWVGLVIGTVLFALARPDISLKKRLKASSYGWIIGLVGVVIGLMFYYLVMVGKYDYGRDFAQVIGIPKAASSNKTIILFKENKQPEVIRKSLSVDFPSINIYSSLEGKSYTLDASEESIQKAMDYLQKRNYIETSLLECRVYYIPYALALNWDFDSRLEWSYRIAKSSGLSIGGPVYLTGYITKSVAKSPKNLKLLEDIAKDERFYISPEACKRLGEIYWSYAQREDALYWYKKAGFSQKQLEEISSKPLPYVEGRIEGKILINDKAVSGIKVGILKSTIDSISKYRYLEKIDGSVMASYRYLEKIDGSVMASTETDLEGVFRLEHLAEGDYRFALMADEKLIPADAKKIKVINAPGKIIIDAQNPTVDLGKINIITQDANYQN